MQSLAECYTAGMEIALYAHIPFCQRRCSYCDFNTYTGMKRLTEPYINALINEWESIRPYSSSWQISSLYLGGGTPSLLPADSIKALIDAVQPAPDAEISLEANPGTVDASLLSDLRKNGVNRLSIGMQSAVPHELRILERMHDMEEVTAAVERARAAGFESINLDLIYGIPGQNKKTWRRSLDVALGLEPDHLSLYALSIEDGTPLKSRIQHGEINEPDPDLAADLYDLSRDMLSASGFDHYEISNWSRPGHTCKHNLTYWRNDNYLGIGAGAWGHWIKASGRGSWRMRNVAHPCVYIERQQSGARPPGLPTDFPATPACDDWESISRPMAMAETMFMGLRLVEEGIHRPSFRRRYGVDPVQHYSKVLSDLEQRGLITWDEERILVPGEVILISNQVLASFLPESES